MTAALTGTDRAGEARQLYEAGLSLRQVAARVGVAHTTVRRLLQDAGVQPRLSVVPAVPRPPQRVLDVPPGRAAIAYSADRGWHMVQAPPWWFLDLLAEID